MVYSHTNVQENDNKLSMNTLIEENEKDSRFRKYSKYIGGFL
jgi:hypothetical protein